MHVYMDLYVGLYGSMQIYVDIYAGLDKSTQSLAGF